jgi:hypothetical protein
LEILPKAIAEQIAEKHKISLPKFNRPFITERPAGLAQMGRGLGKRSTGRKMGDHGKHSFECPMPIIQNPGAKNKVQRSRAAGDISGSARRESDIHRRGSSASNLDLMLI